MNTHQIVYGLCIVLTGLVAGLFYSWQCSVINGLAMLPNKEYLMAFQSMNKAILNPVFFLSFMGSIILLPIAVFLFYRSGSTALLPYLLAATLIYAITVFGITVVCNVPLNEKLAAFNIQAASESQLQAMRTGFEIPWNKWHLIRTIASISAFITLIIPLLKKI
jgi:uncharacterized membrane protein